MDVTVGQQLRARYASKAVCPQLKQFLYGPWHKAILIQAQEGTSGQAVFEDMALISDDLVRATRCPGRPVSRAHRTVLVRQVEQQLRRAGIDDEALVSLTQIVSRLLARPPEHQTPNIVTAPHAPQEPEAALPGQITAGKKWPEAMKTEPPAVNPSVRAGPAGNLDATLLTVPISVASETDAVDSPGDSTDWVQCLRVDMYFRLFLQGSWVTARLNWISPNGSLFMFSSRHAGRAHSLTQRMLHRLRTAGLAIEICETS